MVSAWLFGAAWRGAHLLGIALERRQIAGVTLQNPANKQIGGGGGGGGG